MTKQDLDFYLRTLDKQRIRFYGTDDEKESIKKIDEMAWQAIVKYHSQLINQ